MSAANDPRTPAAARTSSYQSAATVAAASPYVSVNAGKNSRSASRAASGRERSRDAQNAPKSRFANNTRPELAERNASTSALDGIRIHLGRLRRRRSLLSTRSSNQRSSRRTTLSTPLIRPQTRNRRLVIPQRLKRHIRLRNPRNRRHLLHQSIRSRHNRRRRRVPPLRLHQTQLLRRLRQPVTQHHARRRGTPQRRPKHAVSRVRLNHEVFLRRVNRLSRRRIVLHNAQRRNRHPSLTREQRRPTPQLIHMRLHRLLSELPNLRNLALLVTRNREEATHDRLPTLRIRRERALLSTQQIPLRRVEELRRNLRPHHRPDRRIRQRHPRTRTPRTTKRAIQLRAIHQRLNPHAPRTVRLHINRPPARRRAPERRHLVPLVHHQLGRHPVLPVDLHDRQGRAHRTTTAVPQTSAEL